MLYRRLLTSLIGLFSAVLEEYGEILATCFVFRQLSKELTQGPRSFATELIDAAGALGKFRVGVSFLVTPDLEFDPAVLLAALKIAVARQGFRWSPAACLDFGGGKLILLD